MMMAEEGGGGRKVKVKMEGGMLRRSEEGERGWR
jgi:hypothetical protein